MSVAYQHSLAWRGLTIAVFTTIVLSVFTLLPLSSGVTVLLVGVACVGIFAYRLENYLVVILSAAFLARLSLIIGDSIIGFLPTPPIMSSHNGRAIELATAWSNGQFNVVFEDPTLMRVVMAHLLAPFYTLFGHSPTSGRIAIAVAGVVAGYLVFLIARRVVDRRTSVLAAALVLFWPTIAYRSVVIQREVVGLVVLLAFLWAAIQWLERITLPSVAVALFATGIVYAFRKENLLLLAVVVGAVGLAKGREKPIYLAVAGAIAAPFAAYFALNFGDFTGFGSSLTPAAIDAFAYGRAHGDAAYLVGLHYETWLDVIVAAPIKILYFLYTPFPWQISGAVEVVVGASAIALLGATVLARRGIGMLRNRPAYLGVLLAYLLTGVLAYSIVEMNYGAAVRRRIQFVPIILLLVAIGLSKLDLEVRWRER